MKQKKRRFSVVKAVKLNARDRVGQPKATFPIRDKKLKARTKRIKNPTGDWSE